MGTISMDCQRAPFLAFGDLEPCEFAYFISTNILNRYSM